MYRASGTLKDEAVAGNIESYSDVQRGFWGIANRLDQHHGMTYGTCYPKTPEHHSNGDFLNQQHKLDLMKSQL